MLSKILLASLVGLAAAAPPYGEQPYPKAYGSSSSTGIVYNSQHSVRPYASRSISSPAAGYPTVVRTQVITDHTTVTDHVTATDSCASGNNGSGANSPAYDTGAVSDVSAPPAASYTPSTYAGPAPPAQTLQPARAPGHNGSNVTNLAPANTSNLYFAQAQQADTSLQHMFASLNINFTKPSCVLENSDYVSQVSCSTDGLRIVFSGDEGYQYAKKTWQGLNDNFILVSHTDDCNASPQGQQTFWDVGGISFDDVNKACDVQCKNVGIDQAAQSLDMSWGNYKPSGSSSSGAAGGPSPTSDATSLITPAPSPSGDEDLKERGIWGDITSEFGKVTSKVASAVDSAASKVDNPSVSTSFSIPMTAQPSDLTSSPWGQQKEIVSFDDISLFCVDCGLDGELDVQGQLSAQIIPPKLSSATLSLSGHIDANLGLGIQALSTKAPKGINIPVTSKSVQLYSQGLPGLEIPEVVTIGPDLSFSASVSLSLEASGNVLMSAGAKMDDFSATVDLVNQDNSKSSGNPKFNGNLSAQGETTISTTFGLPVSLGFGINFPRVPDIGKKEVDLVNTPGIVLAGNYSNEGSCANGFGWNIHGSDSTSVSILGHSIPVYSISTPDFVSGCLPGSPDNSTASSSPTPSGVLRATRSATKSFGAGPTGTRSFLGYSSSMQTKTASRSAFPGSSYTSTPTGVTSILSRSGYYTPSANLKTDSYGASTVSATPTSYSSSKTRVAGYSITTSSSASAAGYSANTSSSAKSSSSDNTFTPSNASSTVSSSATSSSSSSTSTTLAKSSSSAKSNSTTSSAMSTSTASRY